MQIIGNVISVFTPIKAKLDPFEAWNTPSLPDYDADFIRMTAEELTKEFNVGMKNVDFIQDLFQMSKFHTMGNMPYVAGGYWVRTLLGEPVEEGDIDFFPWGFDTDICVKFASYFGEVMESPKNNHKFNFDGMDYQLMGSWANCGMLLTSQLITFNSYLEMIGYYHVENEFMIHKNTIDALKNRHFHFNTRKENRSHPISALNRLQKMVKRGFTATDEDIKNLATFIADREEMIGLKDFYEH